MRFPNRQDEKQEPVDKHILEILSANTWSEKNIKALKDFAANIGTALGPVESAYMLRTCYYVNYFNAERDDNDLDRSIFRTVLYREEENLEDYCSLYLIMADYKANEIRQCFNLSFEEYLGLTPFAKKQLDLFSKEWAIQMAKAMKRDEEAGLSLRERAMEARQERYREKGYNPNGPGPLGGLDALDIDSQLGM